MSFIVGSVVSPVGGSAPAVMWPGVITVVWKAPSLKGNIKGVKIIPERLLGVLVVMVILAGCWTPPPPPPTIGPPPVSLTALQAYRAIKPAMEAWHREAYVVQIVALSPDAPGLHIGPDGRAFMWYFEVHYDSEPWSVVTGIGYNPGGKIIVGYEGIQGKEIGGGLTTGPVPMEEVIDSIAAASIAQRDSIPPEAMLYGIKLRNRKNLPLSWRLYYRSPDVKTRGFVYVNARTGEIVDNEFTHPTPTPSMPPHVYRLEFVTWGDTALYVTDPLGRHLGIDSTSGEIVNEIPHAQIDQWLALVGQSENPPKMIEFRIPNPLEGQYRVVVQGTPASEERYLHVSVEREGSTKGYQEIILPVNQELSLVYEFTYSLSSEELVSELVQVEQ